MLIAFLFVALIGKLVYIQIFNSKNLQSLALDQWTRDVKIIGERGDICDVNGKILVDTQSTYTVYVRPVAVKNKKDTALVLSNVLDLNFDSLYEKMKSKVSEITAKKKVSKEQLMEIVSNDVTGVYYSQDIKRVYPYGDFMTQVLGFTNIDGEGQSGVESYYNNYLKGENGAILTQTDLVGRELESNIIQHQLGSKGDNIYLTFDYGIQSIVENAVKSAHEKFSAKNVTCFMMNPKTGEVIAMAQTPSYDLNEIPRGDIAKLFGESKSTLISNVFEPGSTFKILTTALALETGKIDTSYTFHCPGYRIVDGQKIKCWKTTGHGSETFVEGVQNSCNALFMDIAQMVGVDLFYEWADIFGINKVTGIDVSGEASGLMIKQEEVKNVDLARMSFGQAIAVTPIELLNAVCSVINGGNLMQPYILDKVVDKSGTTILQNSPKIVGQTISQSTSTLMKEILESVVTDGGGKNAGVNGYRIGGKTGTAQKYENGAIASGKYISTFLGFAPADNPEYALLFIVDEPKGYMYYGSLVAAPYAGDIFSKLFAYKNIEPTENLVVYEDLLMPYLLGLSVAEATEILKSMDLYYEITGESGYVTYQFPVGGAKITKQNITYIEVN